MEHLHVPRLLDGHGHPLSTRIDDVLHTLVPKFQRQFPAVQDDVEATAIFERAGRRIEAREIRRGGIERVHAYAWVALRRVALSSMRRSTSRLRRCTLDAELSDAALSSMTARSGSVEEIERRIYLREAMARLTVDEYIVCTLKMEGQSSAQIARRRGSSVAAVNMVFSRAKEKLRRVLVSTIVDTEHGSVAASRRAPRPTRARSCRCGPKEPVHSTSRR
jgi:DNA-directed RNA polymerase specialized sigma24 family protein